MACFAKSAVAICRSRSQDSAKFAGLFANNGGAARYSTGVEESGRVGDAAHHVKCGMLDSTISPRASACGSFSASPTAWIAELVILRGKAAQPLGCRRLSKIEQRAG